MADFKSYSFCLNDIVQGTTPCLTPDVSVTSLSECVTIKCVKPNNCYEIQVLEGCVDTCVEIIINCTDCELCPPTVITKCFCESSADCADCENCLDDICTPLCLTNQFCDDDECVDCRDAADCECNKECISGSCECPADKPYIDAQGCCKDCRNDADCPPCFRCGPDGCEPIVCTTGICDPDTNNCVGCLGTGDCAGDNECCNPSTQLCECCVGYFRDPSSGDCIEQPDCRRDSDCPTCSICVGGDCTPFVCPTGYIAVPNGNECDCRRECDCDAPTECSGLQDCIRLTYNSCYCNSCEGVPCTNGMCAEGCRCYNGTCVDDGGCNGACSNSGDCGVDCGCRQGQCVSCATLTCVQCAATAGCECTNGVCVDAPCSNTCVDASDCGQGCGCADNECTSCSQVSCAGGATCPDGCSCNPVTNVCQENPCAQIYCSNANDCGVGCGCSDGMCVPCNTLSCAGTDCAEVPGCVCTGAVCGDDGEEECEDNLRINKVEATCDLKGTLSTDACCPCDDIALGLTFSSVSVNGVTHIASYTLTGTLRKGSVSNYANFLTKPLLSATGIVNDLPVYGETRVEVRTEYKRLGPNGSIIPSLPSLIQTNTIPIIHINNDSWAVTSLTMPLPGNLIIDGGHNYQAIGTTVTAQSDLDIEMPNQCKYNVAKKTFFTFTGTNVPINAQGESEQLTKKVLCREPLFKWYKSTSSAGLISPANLFRSVYADEITPGSYQDVLATVAEGLDYGKFYALTSDCGCNPVEYYSCAGDGGAPNKLYFCHPNNFSYTVSDCGLKIEIDEDIVVICDVYNSASPRPTYLLYIDGVLVDTKVLPANGILYAAGQEFTVTSSVDNVTLKIQGEDCHQCDVIGNQNGSYTSLEANFVFSDSPCSAVATMSALVSISGGTGPYSYNVTRNGVDVATWTGTTGSGGITLPSITNAFGTYVLTVTDADGCVVTVTVIRDATALSIANLIVFTDLGCSGNVKNIQINNYSTLSANLTLTKPDASTIVYSLIPGGEIIVPLVNGVNSFTGILTGYVVCTITQAYTVNCCPVAPNFNLGYSCVNGVSLSPNTYNYEIGGTALTSGDPLDVGTYVVDAEAPSGCNYTTQLIVPQCYQCNGTTEECEESEIGTNLGYTSLLACSQVAPCNTGGNCDNDMTLTSYAVTPGQTGRCSMTVVATVTNGVGGTLLMGPNAPNFVINNGNTLSGFWFDVTQSATVTITFAKVGCDSFNQNIQVGTCDQSYCGVCKQSTASAGCSGWNGVRVQGVPYYLATYGGNWNLLWVNVLSAIGCSQSVACQINVGYAGLTLRMNGPSCIMAAIDGFYDSCGNLKTALSSC